MLAASSIIWWYMFFCLHIEEYNEKKKNYNDLEQKSRIEVFDLVGYDDIMLILLGRYGIDVKKMSFFEKLSPNKTFLIIDDLNSVVIKITPK